MYNGCTSKTCAGSNMEIKYTAANFLVSPMPSPLVANKSCFKILVTYRMCAPLL